FDPLRRLRGVECRVALQAIGEVPTLHQFQAEKVGANFGRAGRLDPALTVVEDAADVRMMQCPGELRFATESLEVAGILGQRRPEASGRSRASRSSCPHPG